MCGDDARVWEDTTDFTVEILRDGSLPLAIIGNFRLMRDIYYISVFSLITCYVRLSVDWKPSVSYIKQVLR